MSFSPRFALLLLHVGLLLLEELVVLHGGLLVLLVLGNQVWEKRCVFSNYILFGMCQKQLLTVHVGLGLSELHLVHALTSVPVEESLAPEHGSELLANALEDLLDGGGVSNEGRGHLQATRGDVTDSRLHVVGNPLNKVGGVLVLDIKHLLINLLHAHAATEDSSHSEVAAMSGITGSHHVLGIKHLLGELRDSQGPVLLAATGSKRSKARHEEVEAGEGNHVDSQLPQISIELTRETETGGDTRHGEGDQMVEITICGVGELEGTEADVVKSLIVNAVGLICVLNKLVNRESGIVWLHHSVRDLGRRHNRVGVHDPVGVLLPDLRDEKGAHARSSAATKGVGELEALKAVTGLSLLAHNIKDRVNQLSTCNKKS